MIDSPETFWTLLHDTAHWEFEIFLMVIFDGVVGYLGFRLFWPYLKKHWNHHIERDQREASVGTPRCVGFTATDVIRSYGLNPEEVVSCTLTNDSFTVVLRRTV